MRITEETRESLTAGTYRYVSTVSICCILEGHTLITYILGGTVQDTFLVAPHSRLISWSASQ